MINLIVCMGKNREIGINGDMPWGRSLPADLNHFKKTTLNKTIIMGRKTFDSLGRVLPERKHVILSNQSLNIQHPMVEIEHSIEDVLEKYKEENVFVIGGANIYEQFLPYVDYMYITKIEQQFQADTFFPNFNLDEWERLSSDEGIRDKKNNFEYYFQLFKRKSQKN